MTARLPCPYPISETMEERILHSADLAPLFLGDAGGTAALLQPVQQAPTATVIGRGEIAFVDLSLPDAQSLLSDLRAQRDAGRPIEIITIAADEDGMALIGNTLASRHNIAAVHVLAHGDNGVLQLGTTQLDARTLLARAGEVAAWSAALSDDADLLLYGCDLAQTGAGQQLVSDLAALTGADVAASTDLTGAAALGGNWTLEFQSGRIETTIATSFAQQMQWQGVMATYTVTSTTDLLSLPGTLRWAISQANANAGTDSIVFSVNGNFTIAGLLSGDDNNNSGDLDINGSVNIIGNGSASTTISGNGVDRVLDVRSGTVSISGVTIQGGRGGSGAGIRVEEFVNLTLTDVVVQNNIANGEGAGIFNDGNLTLRNVLIRNNGNVSTGDADGGGIFLDDGATLDALNVEIRDNVADNKQGGGLYIKNGAVATLKNTTIAGNMAKDGGGIYNDSNATSLFNVTLSGNSASSKGGGLHSDGTAALDHVTVASNSASIGGGIFAENSSTSITTKNSLFASNTGGNANGKQVSLGYNLSNDNSGGFSATGDRRNVAAGLLGLASNGGFSRTHAIGMTSAARDSANPVPASGSDQRGVAWFGGRADIGAYEYNTFGASPTITGVGNQTVNEDSATGPLSFTVSDPETPGSSLIVTATSSNQALVPNGNLVLGGSGGSRTISLNALPHTNSSANGGPTTITLSVSDGGNSTTTSFTVNVPAVNDAPIGASKTVTTNEDTTYTFTAADFGFSDPDDAPPNTLASVRVTTLTGAGSLTLSGAAVATGQFVSAANISAGNLKFTPQASANGAGYASFTFQVLDNGGTANGGVDLDSVARTMTLNVTSVNDAPVGASKTVTTVEDTAYTFTAADFGFSDPNDGAANLLASIKISTLPGAGSLALSGAAVATGQFVAAADIAAGNLRFTPAANANGAGYASFTFQVQDNGGTASGGADLDSVARTMTLNVSAVNDAPIGASKTVTSNEDTTYTFTAADFGFSDPNDVAANLLASVKISTLPGAGSLTLSGAAVAPGQFVAAAEIAAGNLRFTPAANANGAGYASFSFQVQDNGGTANGGADLDNVARTMTLHITAVNDAPTNNLPPAQAIASNTSLVFSVGNGNLISISDVDTGAEPVQVTLTAANGTVTLNGTSGLTFTGGDGVGDASMTFTGTVATINARLDGLRFDPDNAFSGSTTLAITTNDLGNTGAGGPQSDGGAGIINVSFVNTAPGLSGANDLLPTMEDFTTDAGTAVTALLLGQVSDPDPGAVRGIAVTAVDNSNGRWEYSVDGGSAWSVFGNPAPGTARLLAADAATFVRFQPDANWNGTVANGITFRAWDQTAGANGDTADATVNGGASAFSSAWARASVNVASVNDAPTGASATVTTSEGATYTFTAADFGFTDPGDASANLLASVRIATLPGAGTLSLNGSAVVANQFVSSLDIAAGQLVFTPGANASGAGYASFTFQVQDTGGTANGGVDLDTVARSMALDVSAVNDAPVGTSAIVTTSEDTAYTFTAADFGFTDPGDASANLLASVRIATLPGAGTLTLNGSAVVANQFVSSLDIAAGQLVFTPSANASGAGYASFTFQVQDNGGTANGGVDLDTVARSMALDVSPVNDAPVLANPTADRFATQDAPFTFTVPGGVFIDVDSVGNLSYGATLSSGGALPTWLSFDPATQTFSGTPANGDVGTLGVRLTVTDSGLLSAFEDFSVVVANVNDAPLLGTPIADQTVAQGAAFNFALSSNAFADADAGDTLNYSATLSSGSALPAWLSFDAGAHAFSGTPGNADVGIATVRVTVTDSRGASAVDDFTLTVGNVNDAPVLAQAIANLAARQASPLQFQLPAATFADADMGDTLRYSATLTDGSALPAWLIFDAQTREFSGTPSAADAGTLVVRVVVADDAGAVAQGLFAITVSGLAAPPATPQAPSAQLLLEQPAQEFALAATATAERAPAPALQAAAQTQSAGKEPDAEASASAPVSLGGPDRTENAAPAVGSEPLAQVIVRPAAAASETSVTAARQSDAILAPALVAQLGDITIAPLSQMLRDDGLLRKLEEMKRQMLQQGEDRRSVVASTIALTGGLSIGYVVWLVRGGILVSSMLSALPAWQMIDPLPVLAASRAAKSRNGKGSAMDADEPEVERLFDAATPGRVAPTPVEPPPPAPQPAADGHRKPPDEGRA